jgi:hypothetical protein
VADFVQPTNPVVFTHIPYKAVPADSVPPPAWILSVFLDAETKPSVPLTFLTDTFIPPAELLVAFAQIELTFELFETFTDPEDKTPRGTLYG